MGEQDRKKYNGIFRRRDQIYETSRGSFALFAFRNVAHAFI